MSPRDLGGAGPRQPATRPSARIFAALALVTGASQFHRAALGVVGPELAADLGAGAGLLGAANGAFFAALLLMQIPVGLALDRIGPRLTVAALALPCTIGAIGQGLADSAEAFLAARFLLGIGCGASFMASVVLSARWYAGPGLTTSLARVFATSQLGILLAGAPFALAAEWLGWRGAYAASGLLTLGLAALWWVWVRDDPPDRPAPPGPAETLAQALRGQFSVWRTPGLLPVLAMHLVGYAAMATVIAVWAGPYLAEVHGMAPETRGTVLFIMGLALVAGLLVVGPIERRIGSRPRTVAGFAALSVLMLTALALWPSAPLPVAVALLSALCLCSCYPVVVVTQGRALFPDHQVGRGVTTVNLAQTLGSAALPAMTGWVVGFVNPAWAWNAAFGTLAACLALGLAGYLSGRRGTRRPD
ncbi:MFS transporter [Roseomonas hellenica]|uniref:MFS transporter n=1 Tax=Plastoroseomonas hellenica TaxID=2687306 RepID=A0ABS5F6Y9_9PROT|nr:MFS transporter [Plastoroseomonas hellenica]